MNRRQFLGGLAVATLGSAGLSLIPGHSDAPVKRSFAEASAADRRRNRFLNVPVTTHAGKEIRFYDDLIKDKTVLVNFFYTNCVGEAFCPMATANLVKVQQILGKRVGRDVFMYSITLDPEHDTPKVLKRYARGFGVKPGWLFLTGKKDDVEALRRNFGDVDTDLDKDREKSTHIGMLRYGIEPLERWGSCPSLSHPKWIVNYLAWMEPGGERPRAVGS
jgi:protein SCO1/2